MTKLVSVEALLNWENIHGGEWNGVGFSPEYVYVKAIEKAPVIEERLFGEWKAYEYHAYHGVNELNEPIWYPYTMYICPNCNRKTVIKENFCPTCGMQMKESEKK